MDPNKIMPDDEWERFFELMEKITNGQGSWQEKRDAVIAQAAANASDTALDEFNQWFQAEGA